MFFKITEGNKKIQERAYTKASEKSRSKNCSNFNNLTTEYMEKNFL